MRELRDFLLEADLGEYHASLGARLKVTTIEHLKYVREEDLEEIGMTRPEMRRLKKFYRKEFPSGAIGKLRKAILRGGSDVGSSGGSGSGSRTLSPSPPQHGSPRPTSAAPVISHPRPIGQLNISPDSLALGSRLGEGDFGTVYQAVWTSEGKEKVTVAAKTLHQDMLSGDVDILREAGPVHELDHECLVRLYGVVHDHDDTWILVNELAPQGSLLDLLRDPAKRAEVQLPRLCDFTEQICDGMTYLERRSVVHRDLAARNILVFAPTQVKIADISLSKMLAAGPDSPDSNFWYSSKIPVAWYAPETIKSSEFSSASDVWSFGVLLWEMFSYGRQPWAELTSGQVLEVVDEPNCERLDQPELCTSDIYQLMCQCWQAQPQARPTFASMLLSLPQLRPTQVKALKDLPESSAERGYLHYRANDVIVVIDKCPNTSAPRGLVWKGVTSAGTLGLFDPTNVIPFIEQKVSPVASLKTTSLARRESSRKTAKKIRADMISQPQNDLRHTGHIGFDGAMFGDVSFIGDAYNKLPPRLEGGLAGSRMSVQRSQDSPDRNGHVNSFNSDDSLDRNKGTSWLSRDSLNSQSTMQSEQDGRYSPSYLDVEDDSLFSDFKMPDLGSSFDFGPSFMDEVLKALDEKEKQVTANGAAGHEVRGQGSAPTPAKRETVGSNSSSGTAPTHGPRGVNEPPKEKKQAKVKPMSASDERMVDAAIARSRELTAHQLTDSHSPPVSPGDGGGVFFDDDSPGLLSKLKNSIKRNGGPEESRQRTFSEELESKGDLDDEVTPEAQQAYNMLVVKGSFKDNKTGSPSAPSPAVRAKPESSVLLAEKSSSYRNDAVVPTPQSRQQQPQLHHQQQQQHQHPYSNSSVTRMEPDLIKDSKRGVAPPRVSAPIAISSPIPQVSMGREDLGPAPGAPVPAARPAISAPTSPPPPIPSKATPPVPAPRPVVKTDSTKRSEIPVPRPRPEIQRVEPTIRQMAPPASPDIPPKKIDSHIPVPAQHAKEREREELKRTIEIVRVTDTDSGSFRDDLSDRAASTSFDRSSARSSQRSSLDRSDNLSENAESERADWEHSECSSDSSNQRRLGGGNTGLTQEFERGDQRGVSSSGGSYSTSSSSYTVPVERRDSLTKKYAGGNGTTSSSLFEEDLSEPSPQEIMSKLRERRLNRQMDHHRTLASAGGGDSTTEPALGISRNRTSAREPQGIPGRAPSIDLEESGGVGGESSQSEEVDTNPLRMLRGGAIPIRTAGGRASASGTGNHGNQGAATAPSGGPVALWEPALNLSSSSPLCRSDELSSETVLPTTDGNTTAGETTLTPSSSGPLAQSIPPSDPDSESTSAAQVARELELLTSTLMEGDLTKVAIAVVDTPHGDSAHSSGSRGTTVERELDKFSASGHMIKFDPQPISSMTGSSTIVTSVVVTTMSTSADSQNAVQSSSLPSPSSSAGRSVSSTKSTILAEKPSTLSLQVKPTLLPTATTPTADTSDSSDDGQDVWVRRDEHQPSSKENPSPVSSVPVDKPTSLVTDRQDITPEKKDESEEERVTPPRLPPRRSMSLSENPEHGSTVTRTLPGQRGGVRRSSSTVDTQELPALPPREPQPWRTPLNARPRERKFPLLVHPPSSSPPSHPNTPSPPTSAGSSPRRVMPKSPIYNTPRSSHRSPDTPHQPPFSNSLHGLSMQSNPPPPPSRPARLSPSSPHLHVNPHPSLPPKQHSLSSLPSSHSIHPSSPCSSMSPSSPHHPFLHPSDTTSSVELPPTYDISISPEFEAGRPALHRSKTDRDREPTHMLIEPHASHKPNPKVPRRPVPPPLAVSLPPSKDLTLSDEPTHIALSSLAQNKLSWSSSFPSPSPLSPSFQHTNRQASSASPPRTLGRSSSHTHGQSRIPPSLTHHGHLDDNAIDNQSPPADLPPAPPTPSYRHKLGLDTATSPHPHPGKPSMVRSFSHNPAASGRGSPGFVYGDSGGHGGHFHSLDLTSAHTHNRVASPSFRHHSHLSPGPHLSSSPTTQQVFPPSPFLSADTSSRTTMDIFAEAPAVPHPYSQTPFHPITTCSSSNPDSQFSATIYSTIVLQPSTSLSQTISPPPPPRNFPHRISSQSSRPYPSPSSSSNSDPLSGGRISPPLSPPRSSSHAVMQAYTASRGASLSPPPRPPPLGSSHQRQHPPVTASSTMSRTSPHQVFQFPATFSSMENRGGNSIQSSPSTQHPDPASLTVSPRAAPPRAPVTQQGQQGEEEEAEVSPLMFTGFSATSSASYEDLQQFSLERQKNCEEIEELLMTFPNEVTVAECMTALEGTRWDVARARKYLQLKKLLSLRLADVHRCKAALVATSWDIQRAADWLLDTNRAELGETSAGGVREMRGGAAGRGREDHTDSGNLGSSTLAASSLSSSSSSMSSVSGPLTRNSPLRSTVPAVRVSNTGTPRRPSSPEAMDM